MFDAAMLVSIFTMYLSQDIRKVVQNLEQTAREILTVLQSVHQPSGFKESEFWRKFAMPC